MNQKNGQRPSTTAITNQPLNYNNTQSDLHALKRLHGESLREKLSKAIIQIGMTPPDNIELGKLHQFAGKRNQDLQTGFCLLQSDNAICGDFDSGVVLEVKRDQTTRMRIAGGA